VYGRGLTKDNSSSMLDRGPKTIQRNNSKKAIAKFFTKRKRPSAFTYSKKKPSSGLRGQSENSLSSNPQAISRLFSATDMQSAERVDGMDTREADTQSLSTQIRTQTNHTIMNSKRKLKGTD
jgi:hypothetical protein